MKTWSYKSGTGDSCYVDSTETKRIWFSDLKELDLLCPYEADDEQLNALYDEVRQLQEMIGTYKRISEQSSGVTEYKRINIPLIRRRSTPLRSILGMPALPVEAMTIDKRPTSVRPQQS